MNFSQTRYYQYTKATNAIMGLNFEVSYDHDMLVLLNQMSLIEFLPSNLFQITLDNAKKLSKAGKNGMKVGKF